MNPYYLQQVERVLRSRRVKTTTPIENMPEDLVETILYGSDKKQKFSYEARSGHTWDYKASFEGVINNLQRRFNETSSDYVKEDIEKYMSSSICKVCGGARLKPEALAVTIADKNINEITTMSVEVAQAFFAELTSTERERQIGHQ